LAFAIWDCIRCDSWAPILRLTMLITLVIAGMLATTAVLGPWSLACLTAAGGTIALHAHRRRRPTKPTHTS
jgi:hypothetical protein